MADLSIAGRGGYQRVLDYRDIEPRPPVVTIAHGTQPTAVQIGALSMIAEPYRPPSIDVRSLVGTLYASKDSLWWHSRTCDGSIRSFPRLVEGSCATGCACTATRRSTRSTMPISSTAMRRSPATHR